MEALNILLLEDEPSHAWLVQKNLKRSGFTNKIIHIDNGKSALDFIFSKGEYANHERPEPLLVLLDLNMPGINGYQVLKRMKEDASTRSIPVIVLTTTDDQQEIDKCYELGCNLYVTKPVDQQSLMKTVRELGFLFQVIAPPHFK